MLPVFMVASDFGICCHGDRLTERARTVGVSAQLPGLVSVERMPSVSPSSPGHPVGGYSRVRRYRSVSAERVGSRSIIMRRWAKTPHFVDCLDPQS